MNEALVENTKKASAQDSWQSVCRLEDITPDTGICALFNDQQVAIFRARNSDSLFVISNYDPIGEANVLSRGILGSLGKRLVVASAFYKQHYDLRTGECVEDDSYSVETYLIRGVDGDVQLGRRDR